MKKAMGIAVALVALATASASSVEAQPVNKLFGRSLQVTGSDYFVVREQIVSQGRNAVPYLKQRTLDRDWHAATIATALLGRIERPDLCRALDNDVNTAVQAGLRAYGGPSKSIPIFALGRESSEPSGDNEAVRCREEIRTSWKGRDAAAFMIETMLKGFQTRREGAAPVHQFPDWGRALCIIRLGISDQPVALTALLEGLQSPERQEVAAPAAWAFGAIDREKAEQTLVVLLKRMTRPQRDYVVLALANIKSPHAVPYLVEVNSNPYSPPRLEQASSYVITRQLIEIGGPEAVQALITMLRDSDTNAAEALAQMKAVEAIEPLIELLQTGSDDTRAAAASSLGSFDGRPVEDALRKAAEDDNQYVRERAKSALDQVIGRRQR